MTQRTIGRSKRLIEATGAFIFRTVSNTAGRRGHITFVGDPTRTNEIYPTEVTNRVRHRWTRIGGQLIELGVKPVTLQRVVAQDSNHSSPALRAPSVLRPETARNPPVFTVTTTRQFSSPILKGTTSKEENTLPLGKMEKSPPRPAGEGSHRVKRSLSPRERLAHWVKRECLTSFWDNAKVEIPANTGSLFNYCLRWISAGRPIAEIIKAFDEALHEMHGTATDVGLLTGDPSLKFNVSSTLLRASARMASMKCNK